MALDPRVTIVTEMMQVYVQRVEDAARAASEQGPDSTH